MRVMPGLFTSILVFRNAVFLIITGGWKDFMFQNGKYLGFIILSEYLQNKKIDSNKTL